MRSLPWTVVLWVLLVSTTVTAREAWASGREKRQGTVLLAGQPGGAPPVLCVAAGLSTLVDFEGLLEPHVLLPPEVEERVGVLRVGACSLVVVPLRDVADGERVLLPVTGRTETGEMRTVTLALVTRRDEVDLTARVVLVPGQAGRAETAEGDDADAVARMLLASHEPGSQPRLSLVIHKEVQSFTRAGDVRARVESLLRIDRRLFVTVAIEYFRATSRPWRIMRFRLEARCKDAQAGVELPPPTLMTKAVDGHQGQVHTFIVRMPEGVECLALTLEEEGPRTLRLEDVRLPP
ncbi:DUF2381 family protein [Archangium violaceum]|uniref:DUF2381 family protein n=1 Tax=Archangium violaceum TaxID=83451 RepID=UPI0019524B01|nr:DUF2381 family protein [Archangium violaceum]QRN97381.1 DUF2381 family protein [Archangium violaceum]